MHPGRAGEHAAASGRRATRGRGGWVGTGREILGRVSLAAALWTGGCCGGEGTVAGVVMDRNGEPVVDWPVTADGTSDGIEMSTETRTGPGGVWSLRLPAGTWIVSTPGARHPKAQGSLSDDREVELGPCEHVDLELTQQYSSD